MAYEGVGSSKKRKTCEKHHKSGVSSYDMQNPELVFNSIGIKKGDVIADLGCGAGDYSFRSAELTGETGLVFACDKWDELKLKLEKRADDFWLNNIRPLKFDLANDDYPIKEGSIDICIMVTVFHIPAVKDSSRHVLSQIKKILKPHGKLAILNCKKEDRPFGPPYEMRLSEEQTENILIKNGFYKSEQETDLGLNYLSIFKYK